MASNESAVAVFAHPPCGCKAVCLLPTLFVDVSLVWEVSHDHGEVQLGAIIHIPRLHTLRVMDCLVRSHLAVLFEHPVCANLKEMYLFVKGSVVMASTESFRRLQHLRVFHICASHFSCSMVAELHQLRSLTDVLLASVPGGDGFTSGGQCVSLRRLAFSRVAEAALFQTLHYPCLNTLEHLSLQGVFAQHARGLYAKPTPFGWREIFSGMSRLRSLKLQEIVGLDCVLAAVQVLPALEMLHLFPAIHSIDHGFRGWHA
jgi:hypothetical protein